MSAVEAFRTVIQNRLGVDPGPVEMDGQVHRFPTKPNGRDEAGWAIGFDDGLPAGSFGDWRSGVSETWCSKSAESLTPAERLAQRERFQTLAKARETERERVRAEAAAKAGSIWTRAARADEAHPYLAAKGVRAHGIKQLGESLVVPLRRDVKLTSLQFIEPGGSKRFLTGGETAGAYFSIGKPDGGLVICEGYATGASIREATGRAVAVAFNAGNLIEVARAMRSKFPGAQIIIAADDDHQTEGNPGAKKAQAAAAEIGALVAAPPFEREAAEAGTDWNDFAQTHGAEDTRRAFEAAISKMAAPAAPARAASTNATSEEPPRPLRRPIGEGEPFPLEALGSVLRPAAEAIADRVQCPAAIAGMSVLAAAALAVQSHADIVHPLAHRPRPVSLFLLTIGASGERKSAADSEALSPVRERERELRADHEQAAADYANAKRAYDAAKAHAEKANKGDCAKIKAALDGLGREPAAPLLPILRPSEPTIEGLTRLLANGQPSIGLFADEGGSFIGGHAMSPESKLRTITGLSSLWDGSTLTRVRAGDGASIIAGKRLSTHLMAQPLVAASLLSDSACADQGFLSRILVSCPATTAGNRLYRKEQPRTATALDAYHRHLLTLLRTPAPLAAWTTNQLTPRIIELSPGARELWIEAYNAIERSLETGGPYEPIRGFANKLAENILRLAAVLALVEDLDRKSVERQHVEHGITLADHFAGEALRLWDASAVTPDIALAERLLSWLQTSWQEDLIGLRAIYNRGPNPVREAATAKRIVTTLEDHGWLKRVDGHQIVDGRPVREAWRIVREG